jgi:hypothetical protein
LSAEANGTLDPDWDSGTSQEIDPAIPLAWCCAVGDIALPLLCPTNASTVLELIVRP